MTGVGRVFVILGVAAAVVGSMAVEVLGLDNHGERKLLRLLLGGGSLLVVAALAAILRALGVRFFHD